MQALEAQIGTDAIFNSWKYFQSAEVKSSVGENWDNATEISKAISFCAGENLVTEV